MFCSKLTYLNSLLSNTCFFHTTQQNAAIGKVMKKILTGGKKKKRLYMEEPVLPTSNCFTKDLFRRPTKENTRRLAVLNKLFMMHITDLMTTGENATQFSGYGLEINRVKVTSDYHGLNVYWMAKDGVNNDELETILQNKSHLLRHELTQLHVIGLVPKIKFIKDKEYAKIVEVESRLAYADFGDDHEWTDASLKYKSHLELTKSLDPKLKEQILALEENSRTEVNDEIPEMPQNVLGLNHSEIMERIKRSVKKSQASHRNSTIPNEDEQHSFNPNPIEFESGKAQREAFQRFLAERQILKNKARKIQKNYSPDQDYLEEESQMVKELRLDLIKLRELDDKDFIDEEYEIDDDINKKV